MWRPYDGNVIRPPRAADEWPKKGEHTSPFGVTLWRVALARAGAILLRYDVKSWHSAGVTRMSACQATLITGNNGVINIDNNERRTLSQRKIVSARW